MKTIAGLAASGGFRWIWKANGSMKSQGDLRWRRATQLSLIAAPLFNYFDKQ